MSEPNLGEQTEEFWEDFHKIAGVQAICNLWDKAFNCWVIEDIARVLIKHGIVSSPVSWTEITDDPATLPPIGVAVWTQSDQNDVEVLVRNDGTLSGQTVHYWERPICAYIGTSQRIEHICTHHASVTITHWRPI